MEKLRPDETLLVGQWLVENGESRADDVSTRIEWLIHHQLQKIMDSPQGGGWETLFRDPHDGRLWERSYPRGAMHGGGPPQLRRLTSEEAEEQYGCSGDYEGAQIKCAARWRTLRPAPRSGRQQRFSL